MDRYKTQYNISVPMDRDVDRNQNIQTSNTVKNKLPNAVRTFQKVNKLTPMNQQNVANSSNNLTGTNIGTKILSRKNNNASIMLNDSDSDSVEDVYFNTSRTHIQTKTQPNTNSTNPRRPAVASPVLSDTVTSSLSTNPNPIPIPNGNQNGVGVIPQNLPKNILLTTVKQDVPNSQQDNSNTVTKPVVNKLDKFKTVNKAASTLLQRGSNVNKTKAQNVVDQKNDSKNNVNGLNV